MGHACAIPTRGNPQLAKLKTIVLFRSTFMFLLPTKTALVNSYLVLKNSKAFSDIFPKVKLLLIKIDLFLL
jgi:hypothetical protein